ncbi:hypothetical protein [Microcoleus sp. SVA1_A4]|uniref:hypothetical protein n=1 Tax=Microcoleus sp. SVA1_A4 TaxID=2818948 RepID=UPI002FCE878C
MPCPYNIILGRDTALPSPLSSPRVQPWMQKPGFLRKYSIPAFNTDEKPGFFGIYR